MPNTNSALEQELMKKEKLPVGWPWRLLLFTIIVFGVTIVTYLGMEFGYKPYLNSQMTRLDGQITSLSQQIDVNQQKNLIDFYSQLVNAQKLLTSHVSASKLFDFLEKDTYQKIYYTSLNFSLDEKSIKLGGIANDYDALSKQLELFRQAPEIDNVFLDDSRLSDQGGISFSITLVFKSELIH